jgi:hypothetical protein
MTSSLTRTLTGADLGDGVGPSGDQCVVAVSCALSGPDSDSGVAAVESFFGSGPDATGVFV